MARFSPHVTEVLGSHAFTISTLTTRHKALSPSYEMHNMALLPENDHRGYGASVNLTRADYQINKITFLNILRVLSVQFYIGVNFWLRLQVFQDAGLPVNVKKTNLA